jgi:hypothetical protein
LCLSQLYLTFYKKENPEIERELLALHCEPEELRASVAAYKRGPHVHISIAEYPLKDAHIALARGHLDEVLANTSNLMESLQLSILMLRDEVVSRY